MNPGPTLFEAAMIRRDRAMKQVEENADEVLLEQWWQFLKRYLRSNRTLFCDEFMAASPCRPLANSRALGPLYVRAAREGLMRKTETYRPSVRSNLSPKVVWESLIFDREE